MFLDCPLLPTVTALSTNGSRKRQKSPNNVNMASQRSLGIERVLSKLESSINSGNYYEAHQMYRTLYFR